MRICDLVYVNGGDVPPVVLTGGTEMGQDQIPGFADIAQYWHANA